MFCTTCGKEISDNSVFCGFCGTPVAAPMPAPVVGAVPPVTFAGAGGTKKKGKVGLVILIVILVLLLAGGGVSAFLFLNNSAKKIDKALEEKDIDTAVELYGDLSRDKDKEEVSEKLLAYAEQIRDDYLNEKKGMDYEAAMETLNLLADASLETDDEIEAIRTFINRIYDSRESYAAAEAYRANGEYEKALEAYANVIEEDARYYENARAAMEETQQEQENALAEEGKALIGTWAIDFDMADALAEELGGDYADFHSSFEMTLLFDFNADGTFKMYVDEGPFTTNFNNWLDAFIDYSMEMVYDEFESYGLSREEVDADILENYGMSMQDYMFLLVGELDVSELVEELESAGTYETRGNKLYMAEGSDKIDPFVYDIFTVNGNKLTLELADGADPSEAEIVTGLSYPLILERR